MPTMTQVFLSYAHEDTPEVERLYHQLSEAGYKPWMDKQDILPGEQWQLSIGQAIRHSDFFLVCLSARSVHKRGVLQRELKNALDVWQEKLASDIYLIPVRLDDCDIPENLRSFQWVNLFENDGWPRLHAAIQAGLNRQGTTSPGVVQEPMPCAPDSSLTVPAPQGSRDTLGRNGTRVRSGLLVLLSVMLAGLLAAAVFEGHSLLPVHNRVLAVLTLGVFALVVAAVTAGILGAGGVVKTPRVQLYGASAIFVVVVLALVWATRQMVTTWSVKGRVHGLPVDARADVSIPGGCQAAVDERNGAFELWVQEACDQNTLHFTVRVEGFATLARQDLAATAVRRNPWVEITWSTDEIHNISGTITQSDSRPAVGALVLLSGCATAGRVEVAPNGGFSIPLPSDCRKPPFRLFVEFHGHSEAIPQEFNKAHGLEIRLAQRTSVVSIDPKSTGMYTLQLSSAPPDASGYKLGSSLWLPTHRPAGQQGILLTPSSPPQVNDLVSLDPLDAPSLTAFLQQFETSLLGQLDTTYRSLPTANVPPQLRELLLTRYRSLVHKLPSSTCDELSQSQSQLEKALELALSDIDFKRKLSDITLAKIALDCR
jgi:hypothetical protein